MLKSMPTLIGIFLLISIQSAVAQTSESENALASYRHSQFVISKATVNPFELAGCMVLKKDGQTDQYINVLPESIKKTLKPQNLTDSVYRTMLSKEEAVKVGFLGLLGISSAEKSLLEISISDRWKMEGPSLWGDNELKKTVFNVGKIYADQGYEVWYNQNVQYSILSSSTFQENSGSVTSAFTYVDASGKRYVQSSNYSQKELISIAPFNLTPLLKNSSFATLASNKLAISQTTIDELSSKKYDSAVIKLNAADTLLLKQNAKNIPSGEFKSQLFK